jgi:Phage regulatory protein CII (CP76)
MQEIIDLLDIAAKNHPLKALAPDIGKAESTLRNELTQQDGYKLGLITTFQILKLTKDYRALDRLESLLGRVAFQLPIATPDNMPELMTLVSRLSKEFGEHMQCLAEAIEDGTVSNEEARQCHKELMDMMGVAAQLKAYLEQLI